MKKPLDLKAACIEYCRKEFPGDGSPAAVEEAIQKGVRMANAVKAAAAMIADANIAERLGNCPCCTQPIGEVITSYTDSTSIRTLYKLVAWCRENKVHEFKSSDVKHLLDHTQYANMNHLDRFGGIVYRPQNPKTGKPYQSTYYGINMERAREFFRNERPAPVQLVTNRITGERIASTDKLMRDFPGMGEFLDGDGMYDPEHIVSDYKAVPRQDGLPTVPNQYPHG